MASQLGHCAARISPNPGNTALCVLSQSAAWAPELVANTAHGYVNVNFSMAVTSSLSDIFSVTADPAGRWQVKQRGGAAALYDTKDSAVTAAVELARGYPPAVVEVYGLDGTLESRKSYEG